MFVPPPPLNIPGSTLDWYKNAQNDLSKLQNKTKQKNVDFQLISKVKKINSMSQSCRTHLFFWCVFDSAKFKLLIFLLAWFFFSVFYELACQNIHKKRCDRHNKTLRKTDFFNSVFMSCILFTQKWRCSY